MSEASRSKSYRAFRALMVAVLLAGLAVSDVAIAANGSVSYSYDALGRVTTVFYDTGVCIAYTYDANGNRTAQTIQTVNLGGTPLWDSVTWGCFLWQ